MKDCCKELTAKIKEWAIHNFTIKVNDGAYIKRDKLLQFLDTLNTSQVESKDILTENGFRAFSDKEIDDINRATRSCLKVESKERAKAKQDELIYGMGVVKETYDKDGNLVDVKRINPLDINKVESKGRDKVMEHDIESTTGEAL